MSRIQITREHSLERNAVREEVQKLADKLARDLSARYHWQEDRLIFTRSGADGFIELGEDKLKIDIKLGLMLTPFKGKIEASIEDYLDRNLS